MDPVSTPTERRGFSGVQVVLIVLAAVVMTAGITLWLARGWVFPAEFQPVELTAAEEAALDDKLERLERVAAAPPAGEAESDQEWLRPEPYDETGASREIELTERELNGLIARDPVLARRLAVDLSDDLASARLLVPMDPDLPLLGGRTLRVNTGLEISHTGQRLAVRLRGVSVMGVPLPNAWLGQLKDVDLVAEFGNDPGFWQSLAAGIDELKIADGQVRIRLRE